MRFRADENVIDLLIGNLLYSTADTAVRELVQNAEDACALQRIKEPGFPADIIVRYSSSANWVEVVDNGLGMNDEAMTESFAAVGAHKDRVSHIRALLAKEGGSNRQIARFGIGIVSCFGVAEHIVVRSKMDDSPGLAYRIDGVHSEFMPLSDPPIVRGTTVRLVLKSSGPMRADQVPDALRRFVRHAAHVFLEDVDSGIRTSLSEAWNGRDLPMAHNVIDPAVRSGVLAPDPAWHQPGSTLHSHLVLCNAGFLVTDHEVQLLPAGAIGYIGELDIQPDELTIQLNREAFAHDERWNQLQTRLKAQYNILVCTLLDEWERIFDESPAKAGASGIDRGILLFARGPIHGLLEPDVLGRVERLVPQVVRLRVWDTDRDLPIAAILDQAAPSGVVYYIREGEGVTPYQQQLQQGLVSIHVTETPQTEMLRAAHLRAKGCIVVLCKRRDYSYEASGANQTFTIHEHDLMAPYCQERSLRWTPVRTASAEEVELTPVKESQLFSALLDLGEQLALVDLPQATDRVIRDFNVGRFLNCAHPEVRDILAILPDAVGNPIRLGLLRAYLDIDNFQLGSARATIKQLLTNPHLDEAAQLSTGRLTREYLTDCLAGLLARPSDAS
jgi:hypothetical protein